jgi:serine/threonine protein kinase
MMNEKELVGVTLGNCTIERVLGRGGMAIVFLAQQARPTRTVAVKVLLPVSNEKDPDQEQIFLERFRREADTVAKLEHKNILPLYEYEEATINGQRLAYLVMPYIRGGTLRQRMDEMKRSGQKFDLQTVSSSISQVADALSYAHSLGVVHRDIKPGNLLFHTDGRLLLSDFGIVRLTAMPSLTMVGSFIGTAEYASPEQVSAGELDSRSDIYSLGIILYEMLTGELPFTGSTPFAVMARHLHDPVPSIRARRPDLSPAIEFVVKKALAKDPRDRYQYATELAADFQAAATPAMAQAAGLRLTGGDAGNSDLTIADSSWQPPRALGSTRPMVPLVANAPVAQVATPPVNTPMPVTKLTPQALNQYPSPPAGGVLWQAKPAQIQIPQSTPDVEERDQVKTYRPSRRLFFSLVGLVMLLLEFVALGLTLNKNTQAGPQGDTSAIILGILLGNALNLLVLAAIFFTAVTRQRNLRSIVDRVLWITGIALIISGFFISYGTFSQQALSLPWLSYLILLASNIFTIVQLGKADAGHEQIEFAPVSWRAAIVGALTGLLPLTLILVFALAVPLPWAANSSLFLRLLGILVITFIGAPTPGAMMAVWLSYKMSFPIFIRTSAIAGLLMFLVAYLLVTLTVSLVSGQWLFSGNGGFSQQTLLPALIIVGGMLGLIGLLRGMLDAWIYHLMTNRRA